VGDCVFCDIVNGLAAKPKRYRECGVDPVSAFEPLNPVTPGHTLIVPWEHVEDARTDEDVSALCMRWASIAALSMHSSNIITSIGAAATQSVTHLHLHVVPRREGDGLALPWTGQVTA